MAKERKPNRRDFLKGGAVVGANAAAGDKQSITLNKPPSDPELYKAAKQEAAKKLSEAFFAFKDAESFLERCIESMYRDDTYSINRVHDEFSYAERLDSARSGLKEKGAAFNQMISKYSDIYSEGFTVDEIIAHKSKYGLADLYIKRRLNEQQRESTDPIKNVNMIATDAPINALSRSRAIAMGKERAQILDELNETCRTLEASIPEDKRHLVRQAMSKSTGYIHHTRPQDRKDVSNAQLRNLKESFQQSGPQQVSKYIAKKEATEKKQLADWRREHLQRIEKSQQETKKESPFRDVISFFDDASDSMFFTLGSSKQEASKTLGLINEMIQKHGSTAHSMHNTIDPDQVKAHVETQDIIPPEKLPTDYPIMVPTKKYTRTFRVEITKEQLKAIEGFAKDFPHTMHWVTKGYQQPTIER